MVEEGSLNTTLGQRLLKEPIWIGLIVILSVLVLFGILYVVRRKCGKHFHCCEIKMPQVDDNILNADGTITLNSFPLRKMARVAMLSPLSRSSSPPNGLTTKIEEDGSSAGLTPSAKNEGAAARFFASYKDAEKTPIAAPLTTDFTRTTDTSLSQEAEDASVGAMVGGRLQLDLHIRENKAQEETMARSISLLDPLSSTRSREKIKRSHSTGPYLVRQATQFDELAVSVSRGDKDIHIEDSVEAAKGRRKLTINDFQHIYPQVIVQEAPSSSINFDGDRTTTTLSASHPGKLPNGVVSGLSHIDQTGARVLAVNLDGDSEGNDSLARSEHMVSPSQITASFRAPTPGDDRPHGRHHHDMAYKDQLLREQEKLRKYVESICEWKDRARLRYKLSKMSSLHSSEEYPRYPLRHRDHRHCSKYSTRHSSGQSRRNRSSVHPLRRMHTADTDPVYFSDVNRRREKFSGSSSRLTASMEDMECERHRHLSSRRRRELSQSSCECPDCEVARDQRYYNRSHHRSRDGSERVSKGSRSRLSKEKLKYRSSSTSVEAHDWSSRHRGEGTVAGGSTRSKHKEELYHLHGKSSRSMRTSHEYSSTESDITRMGNTQHSQRLMLKRNSMQRSSTVPTDAQHPSSPRSTATLHTHALASCNTPEITVTTEIPPFSAEKDFFRKVFSQEIELDDFSPVEEDDCDFVFSSNSNTKESLLGDSTVVTEMVNSYGPSLPIESNELNSKNKSLQSILHVPRPHPLSEPSSPRLKTHKSNVAFAVDKNTGIVKRPSSLEKMSRNYSESSVTPTTCNVIVYDSTGNGNKLRKPHTIKSEWILSRKHSSLELINNDRLAPQNSTSLRSVASLHDLSSSNHDPYDKPTSTFRDWSVQVPESLSLRNSDSFSNKSLPYTSTSNLKIPYSLQSSSSGICLASSEDEVKANNPHIQQQCSSDNNGYQSQSKNFSNSQGSACHLSVTDTDSAMSSAPSPHSTPTDWKTVLSFDPAGLETKVKDSAYQTKQGSLEAEAYLERARRPATGGREEDRKVTQRLHQAAVQLLFMQQRVRRARQNLSRDSAVYTISEDDPTLDEITVTSPKSRTFKPGVLCPAQPQAEDHFPDFPPLQCDRIVEEQDTSTECDV